MIAAGNKRKSNLEETKTGGKDQISFRNAGMNFASVRDEEGARGAWNKRKGHFFGIPRKRLVRNEKREPRETEKSVARKVG